MFPGTFSFVSHPIFTEEPHIHMIEKFYERKDLLIEVARLYYIEQMNQYEIAKLFNTSRSNISKLLKKCHEEGLVEIRISDSSSKALMLGTQLRHLFNLKQIFVVPSEKTYDETLISVGRKAARYLESILRENMLIGIGWGTSLFQMVEQLTKQYVPGMAVVQLHGGLGSRNLTVDGYVLARALAAKLNAATYLIEAPLVVRSKELKELLIKEPNIAESLALGEKADVTFLGIGTSNLDQSALYRAGLLDEAESLRLFNEGAVGMICGKFYDRNGRLLDSEVNDRIIGFDLEKLQKLPLVIGVAAGERKADAILGALRGGYINALITDEKAASLIFERK